MNKKIFGIKIGTILTAFVCLIVSMLVWLLVNYSLELDAEAAFMHPYRFMLFRG